MIRRWFRSWTREDITRLAPIWVPMKRMIRAASSIPVAFSVRSGMKRKSIGGSARTSALNESLLSSW